QAFGVTEPDAGLDTLSIRTRARRTDDGYVVNGQKIWTSRALQSDLMLLLARTNDRDDEHPRWWGLSTFLVDLRAAGEEQARIEAADLMRRRAAEMYERGESCAAEANMAKLLAADASWQAANVCLDTHGGFGFAREFDVERKFRETRLYQVAPVTTNMILSF